MKRVFVVLICAALGLSVFITCSRYQGPERQGGLVLVLEFPQTIESAPDDKDPPRAVETTLDSVYCAVSRNGSLVENVMLRSAQSGFFTADISLPAASGYEVSVECYISGQTAYIGGKTGITITAGETTTEAIPLQVTLPAAPTNLQIHDVSEDRIEIRWSDNSVNEAGFEIQRKVGVVGTFANRANVGTDVDDFRDENVLPNTRYFYRVRAFNAAGTSGWSNTVDALTPGASSAPTPPYGLEVTAVSSSAIELDWRDSQYEDGYIIQRSIGNEQNFTLLTSSIAANDTHYLNQNLSPSTVYFYRVAAFNNVDTTSYCDCDSACTFPPATNPPVRPGNLTATALSADEILITWDDSSNNEDGFVIQRSVSDNIHFNTFDSLGIDEEDTRDSGLVDNTVYWYRIRAYNEYGPSDWSALDSAKTHLAPPAAPTSLTASAIPGYSSRIDLIWRDNSHNEAGFKVERSLSPTGSYTEVGDNSPNDTTFRDDSLQASARYYYKVRAYNAAGDSVSNTADATTNPIAEIVWERAYQTTNPQYVTSVCLAADGDIVITGTEGVNPNTNTLVRKFSAANGDPGWSYSDSNPGYDWGYSIERTTEGGFIVSEHKETGGYYAPGLLKVTSSGNRAWRRTYEGAYHGEGKDAREITGGGYILTGWLDPQGVFLLKTNSIGEQIDIEYYMEGRGESVREIPGGFIVGGSAPTHAGLLLLRTDNNLTESLHETYGSGNITAYGRVEPVSDGYILIGTTDQQGAGLQDILLIKTNTALVSQWERTYGGSSDDCNGSVLPVPGGGYIIGGTTNSFGAGENDVWVIRTDENGDSLWTLTAGTTGEHECGCDIVALNQYEYIVAGYQGLFSANSGKVYLVKIRENP